MQPFTELSQFPQKIPRNSQRLITVIGQRIKGEGVRDLGCHVSRKNSIWVRTSEKVRKEVPSGSSTDRPYPKRTMLKLRGDYRLEP